MTESESSKRVELLRESLVFQLKLFADGVRDLVLVPISLVATGVGLLRSADDPDKEFRRVLELGRQSEQWINLFGHHDPLQEAGEAGSIDLLLTRAEKVVREQYKRGDVSESATTAIEKALEKVHKTLRGSTGGEGKKT